jgi:hypothetical protein
MYIEMPGRSSSRSSFSRSSSKSKSLSSSKSSIPVSSPTPSPIVHNHQVQQPGFFSNMWQGFGLGAGQSIAHNIFRSDPVVKHIHETPPNTNNLSNNSKEYIQCMKESNNDKEACKEYLE